MTTRGSAEEYLLLKCPERDEAPGAGNLTLTRGLWIFIYQKKRKNSVFLSLNLFSHTHFSTFNVSTLKESDLLFPFFHKMLQRGVRKKEEEEEGLMKENLQKLN